MRIGCAAGEEVALAEFERELIRARAQARLTDMRIRRRSGWRLPVMPPNRPYGATTASRSRPVDHSGMPNVAGIPGNIIPLSQKIGVYRGYSRYTPHK